MKCENPNSSATGKRTMINLKKKDLEKYRIVNKDATKYLTKKAIEYDVKKFIFLKFVLDSI